MLQLLLVQDWQWQHSTLKKSEENNLRWVKMCSNYWDLLRMLKQAQVPLVFRRHENSTNISMGCWYKSTSYLGLRHILAALKFSPKFWASLSVMFCFDALCLSKTRYFLPLARSVIEHWKAAISLIGCAKKSKSVPKSPLSPPIYRQSSPESVSHFKRKCFFVHTWSKTAAATDLPHKKRRN